VDDSILKNPRLYISLWVLLSSWEMDGEADRSKSVIAKIALINAFIDNHIKVFLREVP